jgi:3-oxoacyl-[acyl-carrier-protein] synthase-1
VSGAVAILGTGLVTSVGMTAPAACAAMRAKLSNASETRFLDRDGEWLMAHQVPAADMPRGPARLSRMAAMAVCEVLSGVAKDDWPTLPLLLCLAERERPGRPDSLDQVLFEDLQRALGVRFAAGSGVIADGRVSVAWALRRARTMLDQRDARRVLIVATDSLITWPMLEHYERQDRLLTARNSNGFIPGEGAGAVLVGRPTDGPELLWCTGVGLSVETAHIDSEQPLRAEGLTAAIRQALAEAAADIHDIDYRIGDMSGEQYYFKEATLALARLVRRPKDGFEVWHPAECIGETGALAGVSILALADAAARKQYAPGSAVLAHMANDAGRRAAVTMQFRSA